MRIAWVLGSLVLFVIGTLISNTIEGAYMGSTTMATFNTLMTPDFSSYSNPLSAIGGFFVWGWAWVETLLTALTWNYAFFTGPWVIFRIFGWMLSISMIMSVMLALRGTSSS